MFGSRIGLLPPSRVHASGSPDAVKGVFLERMIGTKSEWHSNWNWDLGRSGFAISRTRHNFANTCRLRGVIEERPALNGRRGRFRIRIIDYGKQQRLLQINSLLCSALCIFILRSACCKSLILLTHSLPKRALMSLF